MDKGSSNKRRHNDKGKDEPHGIRLPGSLLDELKGGESVASDDLRYKLAEGMNKKRKVGPNNRKDQRKLARDQKKQKKKSHKNSSTNGSKENGNGKSKDHKKVQNGSSDSHSKSNSKAKIEQKSELSDGDNSDDFEDADDFAGFDDDDVQTEPSDIEDGDSDDYDDFENYDSADFDDDVGSDEEEDFSDDENQPQTAEDTMAALMALKAKKNGKKPETKEPSTAEETMALLKAKKEAKKKSSEPTSAEATMALLKAKKAEKDAKKKDEESKSKSKSKEKESKKKSKREISYDDRKSMKRDEDDIKYYAKKLGLKTTKLSEMKSKGEDDGLGGLLDGLDFLDNYDDGFDSELGEYSDFGSEGEQEDVDNEVEEEEEEDEEDEQDEVDDNDEADAGAEGDEDIVENPFSSDDEINSSDFDSDIGEEDLEDDEEQDGETIMAAPKENPYIAAAPASGAGKYIPPALRRKVQVDSEQVLQIKKSIKGPLNRLSEANVMTIVNQINEVFNDNPRQLVTESLTSVILESIVQQSMLLDTYVILHACLISAIYRLQGVEVGAYFVQTLVEKYEEYHKNSSSKEASNLISLLTACYSFQLISCKLLYNMINELISDISEINTELLLRIIKNAGQQLRSDDPNSLKDIILSISKKVANQELNTRTKFLVETITNLKNNRNKANSSSEMANQLITRMKKVLGSINNNKFHDPLQVTLDDIHNVETKGKWWLVGSAWKGNLSDKKDEVEVNREHLDDLLGAAEPNWMELARTQRMNTDIRRAIFISIMSSNDYIEAFTKLDKLRLKKSQEREIPKIILHCVSMEKAYNPYYGLLANKLCTSHGLRKTFQFGFWDFIRELEGEDNDEDGEADYFKNISKDLLDDDSQLQRILNLGKFFGNLMSESTVPLASLKNVNFLSMNADASLFVEVLLISFLDGIGKKSEIAGFGQGMNKKTKAEDMKFQDKLLLDILVQCKTHSQLLRGLQYFLQEKVRASDIISGRKQRRRVEWGVDFVCDVFDEFLKSMN